MRAVILSLVALLQTAEPAPVTLSHLLARAGQEVRRFEHDFTLVVSDEDYRQHVEGLRNRPRHQRTQAEMLFLWVPDERVWLTVRNVLTVDGQAVTYSQNRLKSAVGEPGPERLARLRRLVDESARFNIGRSFRNFNYPTLVLGFLDPAMQSRFTFTLAGRERVHGTDTWKINYVERQTPTVIQGDGEDRVARGAVWVTVRDNVPVKTRLDVRIPTLESNSVATVEVDYGRDPKLDMRVPIKMVETYMEASASLVLENIGGEATYTNFRRFGTSGRVVTP